LLKRRLLLTIGHTVVRREDSGVWIPSALYQEVTRPDGPDGRIERTHVYRPGLDPNGANAYLGGGQAVVSALHRLWNLDGDADVAVIGGTPPSMTKHFGAEVADVTEAGVMAKYFAPAGILVTAIGGTRNTEDDMRELMKLAQSYERTTVVAMGFRLPRVRLFLRDFALRNPSLLATARNVDFSDAEQFLPEQFDDFVAMHQSAAYRRTMSQERFDVRRLLGA